MGRPSDYSESVLLQIAQNYLFTECMGDPSKLKYSRIAEYARRIGYTKANEHKFRDSDMVRTFIHQENGKPDKKLMKKEAAKVNECDAVSAGSMHLDHKVFNGTPTLDGDLQKVADAASKIAVTAMTVNESSQGERGILPQKQSMLTGSAVGDSLSCPHSITDALRILSVAIYKPFDLSEVHSMATIHEITNHFQQHDRYWKRIYEASQILRSEYLQCMAEITKLHASLAEVQAKLKQTERLLVDRDKELKKMKKEISQSPELSKTMFLQKVIQTVFEPEVVVAIVGYATSKVIPTKKGLELIRTFCSAIGSAYGEDPFNSTSIPWKSFDQATRELNAAKACAVESDKAKEPHGMTQSTESQKSDIQNGEMEPGKLYEESILDEDDDNEALMEHLIVLKDVAEMEDMGQKEDEESDATDAPLEVSAPSHPPAEIQDIDETDLSKGAGILLDKNDKSRQLIIQDMFDALHNRNHKMEEERLNAQV